MKCVITAFDRPPDGAELTEQRSITFTLPEPPRSLNPGFILSFDDNLSVKFIAVEECRWSNTLPDESRDDIDDILIEAVITLGSAEEARSVLERFDYITEVS